MLRCAILFSSILLFSSFSSHAFTQQTPIEACKAYHESYDPKDAAMKVISNIRKDVYSVILGKLKASGIEATVNDMEWKIGQPVLQSEVEQCLHWPPNGAPCPANSVRSWWSVVVNPDTETGIVKVHTPAKDYFFRVVGVDTFEYKGLQCTDKESGGKILEGSCFNISVNSGSIEGRRNAIGELVSATCNVVSRPSMYASGHSQPFHFLIHNKYGEHEPWRLDSVQEDSLIAPLDVPLLNN